MANSDRPTQPPPSSDSALTDEPMAVLTEKRFRDILREVITEGTFGKSVLEMHTWIKELREKQSEQDTRLDDHEDRITALERFVQEKVRG